MTTASKRHWKGQLRREKQKAHKYLGVAEVISVVIDPSKRVFLINQNRASVLG